MKKDRPVYTIFYNFSAIFIAESLFEGTSKQHFRISGKEEVERYLKKYFENPPGCDVTLYGYSPKAMFKDIKRNLRVIKAAGGLVVNNEQEYLFIKRFGIWDLPKGKFNKNENTRDCALREVQEETGVKELSIVKKLSPTYHIYVRKDEPRLKKTTWFLMETNSNDPLVPEKAEDITKAVWFNKKQSLKAISKSYRSLRDTFTKVIEG